MSQQQLRLAELTSVLERLGSGAVGDPSSSQKQLENLLSQFRRQPDSLSQSLAALASLLSSPAGLGSSPHASWFCLSVAEYWSTYRAHLLSSDDASGLRAFLVRCVSSLVAAGDSLRYLQSKALTAYVALAKSCWPSTHPGFVDEILQAIAKPACDHDQVAAVVGLRVLEVASEEIMSRTADTTVPEARKTELKQLMPATSPRVLSALSSLLGDSGTPLAVAREALECACRWCSWAAVEVALDPGLPLLEALFCHLRSQDTRTRALDCMLELLARPFVPVSHPAHSRLMARLTSIFDNGGVLVAALAAAPAEGLAALADETSEDGGFLRKATLFANTLLMSMKRVTTSRQGTQRWAGAADFARAHLALTTRHPRVGEQLECVEAWAATLEELLNGVEQDEEGGDAKWLQEAWSPVISEAQEKVLLLGLRRFNRSTLESLDDHSTTDYEDESELGIFVAACLNVSFAASELLPATTLPRLLPFVATHVDSLLASGAGSQIQLDDVADAATLLALSGKIAELFSGDNLAKHAQIASGLFERVLACGVWATSNRLYAVSEQAAVAHARIVGSLPAWNRWLSEVLRSEAGRFAETVSGYAASVVDRVALPLLTDSATPHHVALSAAQTFRLICESLHLRSLLALPSVEALIANPRAAIPIRHQASVRTRVYQGLVGLLALPFALSTGSGEEQQQWTARKERCSQLLRNDLAGSLVLMAQQVKSGSLALDATTLPELDKILTVLRGVLRTVGDQSNHSKSVVIAGMDGVLPAVVDLCCSCSRVPAALLWLIEFTGDVFDCLGARLLGPQVAPAALNSILTVVGGADGQDNLTAAMADPDGRASQGICRMLDLLRALSRETSAGVAASLLPGTLWFALERVARCPQLPNAPSVLRDLLKLLSTLLVQHWQEISNQRWFAPAMDAFMIALSSRDIGSFAEAVDSLEKLGGSGRLFERPQFRTQGFASIAATLLGALVTRTQTLHREEAAVLLFSLARADWQGFFGGFLPQFVSTRLDGVTPDQRQLLLSGFSPKDSDQPTFISNVLRLINDYNYYLLSNGATSSSSS